LNIVRVRNSPPGSNIATTISEVDVFSAMKAPLLSARMP
jgi:hypothetical protein